MQKHVIGLIRGCFQGQSYGCFLWRGMGWDNDRLIQVSREAKNGINANRDTIKNLLSFIMFYSLLYSNSGSYVVGYTLYRYNPDTKVLTKLYFLYFPAKTFLFKNGHFQYLFILLWLETYRRPWRNCTPKLKVYQHLRIVVAWKNINCLWIPLMVINGDILQVKGLRKWRFQWI